MNRIQKLFTEKKQNILSIYFTAGFPKVDNTVEILTELQSAGVDMIEIGMPFSDPLADGPVIQQSSEQALKNGMSLSLLFEQLEKNLTNGFKSNIPILLMGYLNPVLQYGIENFCKRAKACGVDGVILPDLPLKEYLQEFQEIFEKYGLLNILLITPQTSEERIRLIDEHSKGFIYVVSSAGTTGVKNGIDKNQENYFQKINAMKLKNPLMIGFGISDQESFTKACAFANGAIIGSAFIKAIQGQGELKANIQYFIKSIR